MSIVSDQIMAPDWKSKDDQSHSNVNSGDHECLYQFLDGPSSGELQEWVIKPINNKEYVSIFALPVASSHRLRVFLHGFLVKYLK